MISSASKQQCQVLIPYLIRNFRSHRMLYAIVWGEEESKLKDHRKHIRALGLCHSSPLASAIDSTGWEVCSTEVAHISLAQAVSVKEASEART